MNNHDISTLKMLDSLLNDLYLILVKGNELSTSYAKHNIQVMRKNIGVALSVDSNPSEIFSLLRTSYSSMFPPKGGLSEFYIWHDDFHVRHKLNMEYKNLKQQIEQALVR